MCKKYEHTLIFKICHMTQLLLILDANQLELTIFSRIVVVSPIRGGARGGLDTIAPIGFIRVILAVLVPY